MAVSCLNHLHRGLVTLVLWPGLRELHLQIVHFVAFRVEGYSMDYLTMNIVGYVFYSSYSTLGYFFHMKGAGTVVIADLVFPYHALFICLVMAVQAYIYPRGKNRQSAFCTIFCSSLCVFVLV